LWGAVRLSFAKDGAFAKEGIRQSPMLFCSFAQNAGPMACSGNTGFRRWLAPEVKGSLLSTGAAGATK
jgi:hypothetical protein